MDDDEQQPEHECMPVIRMEEPMADPVLAEMYRILGYELGKAIDASDWGVARCCLLHLARLAVYEVAGWCESNGLANSVKRLEDRLATWPKSDAHTVLSNANDQMIKAVRTIHSPLN